MKILAVDQARHGAWALFDYEEKKLLDYGTWTFDNWKYTYEQAILKIEALIAEVIITHDVGAVFLEDIQLRNRNIQSFKRLAQLQGVLVNLCERANILYDLVAPSQWQNFCNARGRTTKEIKEKIKTLEINGKKASKAFSIVRVSDLCGVETDDDNLADAVLQGYYVVNKIKIGSEGDSDEKE